MDPDLLLATHEEVRNGLRLLAGNPKNAGNYIIPQCYELGDGMAVKFAMRKDRDSAEMDARRADPNNEFQLGMLRIFHVAKSRYGPTRPN